MSLNSYHRQKAAAKLRRLSAFERARNGSASSSSAATQGGFLSVSRSPTNKSNSNGSSPGGSASGSQQLSAANVAALLDGDAFAQMKEYFTGDRFQHPTNDGYSHSTALTSVAPGGFLSPFQVHAMETFEPWRMENKMRTVAAALCMCLNIGTDPPGIDRPNPCAMLECWLDPNALQPPEKSLELIGQTLQQQYSRWQPKAKYELLLDPTSGAVKRMCVALRRHAKHERILFHYNGHGVPKPTTNGEIWVFDKSYTLYVPLSIYDLLTWLGGPAIIVLDCSAAGALSENFQQFLRQKADEARQMAQQDEEKSQSLPDYSECILLGSCLANQSLPLTPASLPMDLFTSCLTTPLKIALKFFASNSVFGNAVSFECFFNKDPALGPCEELIDKIPGKINDRKTPLGELNWIYTAITDTIAWNILPRPVFQKLFRQDLLLASLLRNFLLATRIMTHFGCTTFAVPALPQANLIAKHSMWQSWDLCCEQYLLSLDKYLNYQKHAPHRQVDPNGDGSSAQPNGGVGAKFPREYINFFSEHLLAFEVWLEVGTENMAPPLQLPIVLQVLLSPVHRRRALILFARFIGKGSWAVQLALSVGIFPYVLKLLQSPDLSLREVLIFIWSKLIALDKTVQQDLIKEHHETYFLTHLAAPASEVSDRQKVMSGFILATLCDGCPQAQEVLLQALPANAAQDEDTEPVPEIFTVTTKLLESESPSLRKWMCLLLGKLWCGYEAARASAVQHGIPEKLCTMIADPVPEVRAAALYALGTFMSTIPGTSSLLGGGGGGGAASLSSNSSQVGADQLPANLKERHHLELMLAKNFSQLVVDASPLVREELVLALVQLIEAQKDDFIALAHERLLTEDGASSSSGAPSITRELSLTNSGGGGGSSVPPSPSMHGYSSPALIPYTPTHAPSTTSGSNVLPSSSYTPSSTVSGGQNHTLVLPGSYQPPSSSGIPPSPALTGLTSPALRAASGSNVLMLPPSSTLAANNTTPLLPHASLTRATSEGSITLNTAATAAPGGLAISLSPTMMASGNHARQPPPTPLSPLHLQPMPSPPMVSRSTSASYSSGSGLPPYGGSTTTNVNSSPAFQFTTPPTPHGSAAGGGFGSGGGSQRGSMIRAASVGGNLYQANNSSTSVTGASSPQSNMNPTETAQFNQRLLLLRVIRTLSHDPFPTVASVALSLRKLLSRASSSTSTNNGVPITPSHSMFYPSIASVQGSPTLSSSMSMVPTSIGPLNTVPEQSLNDYVLDSLTPVPTERTSLDGKEGAVMNYPPPVSSPSPSHARGRSDGAITLVTAPPAGQPFENVVTRPRSRPVSEIDNPPPPAPGGGNHQQATLGAPTSILGVMGGGGNGGGGSTSQNRAPSPSLAPPPSQQPRLTSHSSNPSPSASPVHRSTPAPGQTQRAGKFQGQRLTFSEESSGSGVSQNQLLLQAAMTMASPSFTFNTSSSSSAAQAAAAAAAANAPIVFPPSTIYPRACEYFIAPVGSTTTNTGANATSGATSQDPYEDPEAVLERLLINSWRHKRNLDLMHSASQIRRDCYDVVDRGSFDQIAALSTGFEQVSTLLFHPFENMLVISEKRSIGIWDLKDFERINQFSNENARGSKISCTTWINEHHQSLLMCGSDDGVVRVWKNVHLTHTQPEIVSAWLAVRSMPRGSGVGLVLDWQQERGHLLAAGPVDSIRVWDVEREICVLDLPVDSDHSYVSSVCSMHDGSVVFAGCGDGLVRMFDLRATAHQIHTVTKHPGPVVNVRVQRWQPDQYGDLISGGANGDIHVCDSRMLGGTTVDTTSNNNTTATSSIVSLSSFEKPVPLDALAIHDHAPLFAAGSRKQVVRIADFKGENGAAKGNAVSTLKYHKGFMGHRIGPVTALTFHPHKLLLAVGALNPLVSIMAAFPPSSM